MLSVFKIQILADHVSMRNKKMRFIHFRLRTHITYDCHPAADIVDHGSDKNLQAGVHPGMNEANIEIDD